MMIKDYNFNIATFKELKLNPEEVQTLFWSLQTMINYCNNRIIEIRATPHAIDPKQQIEFYEKTINEANTIKEKLRNADGYLI